MKCRRWLRYCGEARARISCERAFESPNDFGCESGCELTVPGRTSAAAIRLEQIVVRQFMGDRRGCPMACPLLEEVISRSPNFDVDEFGCYDFRLFRYRNRARCKQESSNIARTRFIVIAPSYCIFHWMHQFVLLLIFLHSGQIAKIRRIPASQANALSATHLSLGPPNLSSA